MIMNNTIVISVPFLNNQTLLTILIIECHNFIPMPGVGGSGPTMSAEKPICGKVSPPDDLVVVSGEWRNGQENGN